MKNQSTRVSVSWSLSLEVRVKAAMRQVKKFIAATMGNVGWIRIGSSRSTSRVIEAIIDFEKKYVFLLNPKVGSRTLLSVLSKYPSTSCVYLDPVLAKKLQGTALFAYYAFGEIRVLELSLVITKSLIPQIQGF